MYGAKYAALSIFVLQNAGVVLLMRYTRSTPGQSDYLPSVVVVCTELTKFGTCALILALTEGFGPVSTNFMRQCVRSGVPALLYLVQNNLVFLALNRVDAPTFQVLYQSKIVLTALLSVVILGRKLGARQWVAVLLLTIGVVVTERPLRQLRSTP